MVETVTPPVVAIVFTSAVTGMLVPPGWQPAAASRMLRPDRTAALLNEYFRIYFQGVNHYK